jgi:hypothetical protein
MGGSYSSKGGSTPPPAPILLYRRIHMSKYPTTPEGKAKAMPRLSEEERKAKQKIYQRNYINTHREENREGSRRWRKRNKDLINEFKTECKICGET